MKFLLDNLLLIAVALISGGLLLWPLIKRSAGSGALSPLEATQLINHRNAIVVDVRDEKDFALGSLAAARNLPFATLAERASELVRFKARPVLIVCDAGQQSAKAVGIFKTQGFDEAHSLAGGVAAWKTAGLPLVQSGRDVARAANREPARKVKGDNRSNDRGRGSKGGRAGSPDRTGEAAVGSTPVVLESAAPHVEAVDVDAPADGRSPSIVKELS